MQIGVRISPVAMDLAYRKFNIKSYIVKNI